MWYNVIAVRCVWLVLAVVSFGAVIARISRRGLRIEQVCGYVVQQRDCKKQYIYTVSNVVRVAILSIALIMPYIQIPVRARNKKMPVIVLGLCKPLIWLCNCDVSQRTCLNISHLCCYVVRTYIYISSVPTLLGEGGGSSPILCHIRSSVIFRGNRWWRNIDT